MLKAMIGLNISHGYNLAQAKSFTISNPVWGISLWLQSCPGKIIDMLIILLWQNLQMLTIVFFGGGGETIVFLQYDFG